MTCHLEISEAVQVAKWLFGEIAARPDAVAAAHALDEIGAEWVRCREEIGAEADLKRAMAEANAP
jgi:hypothetical protein